MFIKVINILAIIAGIIGSFAYFFQAYKIVKTKSTKSLSILTYFIFLTTIIIWMAYGLAYNSVAIIISNSIGFVACSLVIISYFIFRHHKHYCDECHKLFTSSEEYHKIKLKHPHNKVG